MKKKTTTEIWESDITDISSISESLANLLIGQGETLLKETVETAKLFSAKADRILAAEIPVVSLLSVYIFNNLNKSLAFLPLSAIMALVVLFVSLFYIYRNVINYTVSIPGSEPKKFAKSAYFVNKLSKEDNFSNIAIQILEDIQLRITNNRASNEIRALNNQRALETLLILPACPLIAGFVGLCLEVAHVRCL